VGVIVDVCGVRGVTKYGIGYLGDDQPMYFASLSIMGQGFLGLFGYQFLATNT
jgi:hypothetical protein